jgi:lysozyme-like protein
MRPTLRGGALAALAALLLLVPLAAAAAADPGPARPASLGPGVTAAATPAAADLCARVASTAGFRSDRLVMAVAIGLAESDCTTGARHPNGATAGCPYGSLDRGLWQINDCYHAEVRDSCAYNAQCNANAAYTISAGGTNWQPWTTYINGDYAGRLAEARAAVARLGGGGGGVTGTVIGGGAPLTVRSGPGTGYAAVGSVADGGTVTILCQTRGQSITGPYGATALWDRIGSGRYVTDAYVFTGSNGQVAPTC